MKKTLFSLFAFFAGIFVASGENLADLKFNANRGEISSIIELAKRYETGEGVPSDKSAALCYYLLALKKEPENAELRERAVALGGDRFLPGAPGRGISGEKYVADLGDGVKMEFLKLPAGTFLMGSPKDEPGYFSDEKQVEVSLTKDFFLGVTEVTQAQWDAVTGKTKKNPSHFRGENRPVECVTWDDAIAFCTELTKRERAAGRLPRGMKFTLPTEAQWEYACRAGTQTRYSFGDAGDEIELYGNVGADFVAVTRPVGNFRPNTWGFFDMIGNVSEWCLDSYSKELCGGKDPHCTLRVNYRVLRGGSCDSSGDEFRAAARAGYPGNMKNRYLGFRVALVKE